MKFEGGGIALPCGITQISGISGTSVKANNLRGIGIPVDPESTEISVKFPVAEPDAEYAVFVETNWLTARAVTGLTKDGFVVKFEKPPVSVGALNWLLVR
jgi:hypothetical protein